MVSIVIPMYNVESYILRCLKSIANQSCQDFELVIVDDGSTDQSAELVSEFLRQSSMRSQLIRQKNQGVSVARNTGIAHSSGDYLCFVDSDDALDCDYINNQLTAIKSASADLCVCRAVSIPEEDDSIHSCGSHSEARLLTSEQAMERLLYHRNSTGIWALMVRRDTLGSLRFSENYHYSEDLEMVWKLTASAKRIAVLDDPLYCYRIREGSAMTRFNEKRLDGLKLFQELETFLQKAAPSFAPQFHQYGVARWVWSTIWQEAMAASSYQDFCERAKHYDPIPNMRRLLSFPDRRVRISSWFYLYCRPFYYFVLRRYRVRYRKLNGNATD